MKTMQIVVDIDLHKRLKFEGVQKGKTIKEVVEDYCDHLPKETAKVRPINKKGVRATA